MDARHVVFKLVVWKRIALNFISLAINSTNKGYDKVKGKIIRMQRLLTSTKKWRNFDIHLHPWKL